VKYAQGAKCPGGAIAVVDAGGNLIYLERLDNTFAAASEVATKKSKYSGVVQSTVFETRKFDQWRKTGIDNSWTYFFTGRHSRYV